MRNSGTDTIIIGNPASGKGNIKLLKHSAERLERHGRHVEIWPTERADHATELATLAGDRLVIAAGGDGTINEVVNGLHEDSTLGIIPVGTANVLARELGIPLNQDRAVTQILKGETQQVDIGVARNAFGTERRFVCMAGIGFDANVVEAVPAKMKKNLGAMAFALTAFKVLAIEDLPFVELKNNGDDYEAQFVIIANGYHYGGDFRASEDASLTNGKLDVVLVEQVSRLLRPDILTRILSRQPLSRDTRAFSATTLKASSKSRVPVQLDGEVWGELPMSFRVEPGLLKVIR